MDDIKIAVKYEKELKLQIQTIRIYSKNIGMEFRIANNLKFYSKNEPC